MTDFKLVDVEKVRHSVEKQADEMRGQGAYGVADGLERALMLIDAHTVKEKTMNRITDYTRERETISSQGEICRTPAVISKSDGGKSVIFDENHTVMDYLRHIITYFDSEEDGWREISLLSGMKLDALPDSPEQEDS